MSLARARKAFNLELVDGGFALFELIAHPGMLEAASGISPYEFPRQSHAEAYKNLDVDFVLVLPDSASEFPDEQENRP